MNKINFASFMEEFLQELNIEKISAMPVGKQKETAKRLGYTAWDADRKGKTKKAETATKAEIGVRSVFNKSISPGK